VTLPEFLAPLSRAGHRHLVLGVLYYEAQFGASKALTPSQIRSFLRRAAIRGARRINVSDVLLKSGPLVHRDVGSCGAWRITTSGLKYLRDKFGIPTGTVAGLDVDIAKILGSIQDEDAREYFGEALICIRSGALRAAVVFIWVGSIRLLQDKMLQLGTAQLNAALLKHDPKSRNLKDIDGFAYVKDKLALLAAQELGILDKHQKDVLQGCLDLRNLCGHPGKYRPGEKKVSAYVEDILTVLQP